MSSDIFLEQQKALYSTYRNADINMAKAALEEYLNLALKYQEADIEGIHYATVLTGTYIRLYMIDNYLKNTDAAERYLDKAFQIALSQARSEGLSKDIDIEKEKSKIIEFYRGIDIKNSVQWMQRERNGLTH